MQTKPLHKEQCITSYGEFEIELTVGATTLPDLADEKIRAATFEAVKLVKSAVLAAVVQSTPAAMDRAVKERKDLLALFGSSIFVEEIPNGYCSDWCCRHFPWFVVTTQIGRIKIGWRKRVILIDWEQSAVSKSAEELFPEENVTKGGRMIHAWGLNDARRYIATLFQAGPPLPNYHEHF